MPIWLRNTTYKFISDSIDTEQKIQNKTFNNSGNNLNFDISNPEVAKAKLPNQYIKASKK
jgi:hypothetical protein